MSDHEATPLEQVLDLLVYAPVGLALTARDNMPGLVAKGRERLNDQLSLARLVGQFAVKHGQTEAGKRVEKARKAAEERLSAFSSAGEATPPPAAPARPAPTVASPSAPSAPPPTGPGPVPAANGRAPGEAGTAGASPPTRPTATLLAIPGYDALSASQVVQRLAGLSADELEAVRIYESVTRGRKTILSKIAQQQTN
jgi:hypothetical protein